MYKEFSVPEYATAEEIRDARKKLGLSQDEFARMIGCSKPTVVRWESAKNNITGPIVYVVNSLRNKANAGECVLPIQESNLRLKYYYKQRLCTVIDVDEVNEKVSIVNYTDSFMFRAFGNNLNPTYADYQDFLESRCFPRTRDKIKLELESLNIPFYEPLMIVEKTKGRMAEDDFWLEMVRK